MLKKAMAVILGFYCVTTFAQMDLKSYYEQQKAALRPTFVAPELGTQITIHLKSGQTRTGVLMKLNETTVSMMSDSGSMINYQSNTLKETSRALLFAEDFAHVKALEKTKLYKLQQQDEFHAEQQAGVHDGSISVNAKTSKETKKDTKEEERKNKNTGAMATIATKTKTETETQKLTVTVTNKAAHPDKFTVEYYFFGKTVSKGKRPKNNNKKNKDGSKKEEPKDESGIIKLVEHSSRTVTVDARSREQVILTSKDFEVNEVETTYNGRSGNNSTPTETGMESAGYLVVLKYGSTVLDKKSSARTYLSDEWLREVEVVK